MSGSTSKRSRTITSSPVLTGQMKKNSKMDISGTLDDSVSNSDVIARLEHLINDNKRSLMEYINNSMTSLTEGINKSVLDIQADVSRIRESLNEKFEGLESKIASNSTNHSALKNESDRRKFLKDVYIDGIPTTPDENLKTIFHTICKSLGYEDNDVPAVFIRRLKPRSVTDKSPNKNITKSPSKNGSKSPNKNIDAPRILIEFSYYNECREFKSSYFARKGLNLTCLGYTTSNRIFVNDRLTKHDADIKFKALALKSENIIHSVGVFEGRVYIKVTKDSKKTHIDDVSELPVNDK
jgi:hypothetical protein